MNFKNIHLGKMIEQCVAEKNIDIARICNFMKEDEREIQEMYRKENLPTDIVLKWSKLLEYDFFRIFSQHLILYAPPESPKRNRRKINSSMPHFRKNIYTKEIIDFILDQLNTGEMTKTQVIQQYNIPKTTLYKWIYKYQN
ncbi:transposase [Chryseobacterium sp.]|uniref:transposase n=1 Tax=Chryseobacterium sp. TaxID=1871047 RepID=UPI0032195C0C